MMPRFAHSNPALIGIFFFLSWCGFAQNNSSLDRLELLLSREKSQICITQNNNLCVSPANDIVMSLQGCATGNEFGFPTFEINVPPGADLTFQMTKNPVAAHDSFFLVNQAVANTPPGQLDICTEQNPGIYTPPLEITPFDAGSIPIHTVPSAVVDQMASESALNGFVVMIARDCQSSLEAFAGVRFTRNPVSTSPLALTFESGPLVFEHATTNTFVFKVENQSNQPVEGLALQVGQNYGNIGLISIMEDGGSEIPITNLPFQLPFNLASNQFKLFTVKLTAYGIGLHEVFAEILSDFCENNGRQDVPFSTIPYPVLSTLIGKGRVGDSTETELTVTNPSAMPVEARVTGSDENGRVMPLDSIASGDSFLGNNSQLQLAPGQSQTLRFSSSDSSINRFMVHVTSDLPILAVLRQSRRVDTRSGTRHPGSTSMMRDYNTAVQSSGQGVIPYRVVAAENKKIIVDNYNLDARVLTINIRDAASGNVLRSFSGVLAGSLAILPFPLVAGLDDNSYIEIDGGPGVFAELEQCSANDFNVYKMRLRQTAAPFAGEGSFSGTPSEALPFSQVAFPSISYGPSTYDMFVFPLTDQGIAPNSVAFEYDEQCDVGTSATSFLLTSLAQANATIPIMLPSQTLLRGGFAFFNDSDTTTGFRWVEGDQTFYMQAVEATTKGRLYIPKVLLPGLPAPQTAPIRFQVFSETGTTLGTALVAQDGSVLGLKNIVLTAGGHQLCSADFGITEDTAFLEIQIPEDHPSPFWFNALADEARLDYKDQLPLLPVPGLTILTQINQALATWGEGGGPSCLGDAPDMVDLVAFVNNGYMCPATP